MRHPNPFWLIIVLSLAAAAVTTHHPVLAQDASRAVCQAAGSVAAIALVQRMSRDTEEIKAAFEETAAEWPKAIATTLRSALTFALSLPANTPPEEGGKWAYDRCRTQV